MVHYRPAPPPQQEASVAGFRACPATAVFLYSWGFDEIIRAHPNMARGNSHALCFSEPQSWHWMKKVVDFVFDRFEIDGVSMQSADLERCPCDRCKVYSDAEYHALLNCRTAEYHVPIYEGDIDFARVISILRKAGYMNDLCVENESLGRLRADQATTTLAMAIRLLKKLCAATRVG